MKKTILLTMLMLMTCLAGNAQHFKNSRYYDSKTGSLNYKYQLEKEQADPSKSQNTLDTLTRNAHSPEFMQYIHQRILDHITIKDQYRRPYVFLYGIGSMFPYLRVNEFLALYEDYNETGKYKIIVFYPGHRDQNSFRLFGTLPDNHTYRATLLINE